MKNSIKNAKTTQDSFLLCNILVRGLISDIHNLITGQASSLDKIRRTWEEDLGRPLLDDTWDSVHSSSMCAQHSLIQFIVQRALSKVKLV